MILSDDDIEAMLRELVEKHLAEEARAAALNWLEKRSLTYQAVVNLGLLDQKQADD
jgi:hypothetical protein